jgi:hypothetical protein
MQLAEIFLFENISKVQPWLSMGTDNFEWQIPWIVTK